MTDYCDEAKAELTKSLVGIVTPAHQHTVILLNLAINMHGVLDELVRIRKALTGPAQRQKDSP